MSTFSQLVEAIIAEQTDLSTAAETLYSQLSPQEKLWLLDGDSTALSFVGRFLKEGYCFRPHNAGVVERLGIPGIRFTDGPRGILMGHNSTAFPTSSTRACTWDPKLEERVVSPECEISSRIPDTLWLTLQPPPRALQSEKKPEPTVPTTLPAFV